jgi:integrase
VRKLCEGRRSDEPIFTDPKGRPWDRHRLDLRFKQVRERAEVRADITIYSFRHLWISEALMAGIDPATVAKMAGTSIAMIEKVYGHYRNDHFADAQKKLMDARSARTATGTAA